MTEEFSEGEWTFHEGEWTLHLTEEQRKTPPIPHDPPRMSNSPSLTDIVQKAGAALGVIERAFEEVEQLWPDAKTSRQLGSKFPERVHSAYYLKHTTYLKTWTQRCQSDVSLFLLRAQLDDHVQNLDAFIRDTRHLLTHFSSLEDFSRKIDEALEELSVITRSIEWRTRALLSSDTNPLNIPPNINIFKLRAIKRIVESNGYYAGERALRNHISKWLKKEYVEDDLPKQVSMSREQLEAFIPELLGNARRISTSALLQNEK